VRQGPGAAIIGGDVSIAQDALIGAHVVIHDGTVVKERCRIEDLVVLGKRPHLAAHSTTAGETRPLILEHGVSVGSGAIVFAGSTIGAGTILGDQTFIRERVCIGSGTVVGRGSQIDNDTRVGARVRIQSSVYLTGFCVVEDDVFIGPGVVTTNDDTMGRKNPGTANVGATFGRACRVGGGAVITPGVELGAECYVAAGALVTRDVAARAVVMGAPARAVRAVGAEDLLARWR